MQDHPFRGSYAVEYHVREPNEEEWSLIRQRRAQAETASRSAATAPANEPLALGGIGLAAAAGVWWFDGPLAAVLGVGILALLTVAFGLYLRQVGLADMPASPWGGTDRIWRIHEARVRARSVVFAQGGEESDFTVWMLFEIPGSRWAAVDAVWLPADEPWSLLAREAICIRWLEPARVCIGVEAVGDELPRYGALGLERDEDAVVHAALEAGFVWPGPDAEWGTGPIFRIDEAELPEWMRNDF